MTQPSRTRTMARRSLLVAASAGGLMLAGAPLAGAAPSRAAVPAIAIASPGTGVPVFGGLIDSIAGILTGTAYGIVGATSAVACSVAPVCPPVKDLS